MKAVFADIQVQVEYSASADRKGGEQKSKMEKRQNLIATGF